MAHLINSTEELKCYLGGAINTSIDYKSIEPYLTEAWLRHIDPWVPWDFYQIVVNWAAEGEDPYATLKPLINNCLSRLALYEYLPYAVVQMTEQGMMRVETEEKKGAYKYQELQYRRGMLTSGYNALERLVEYLVTKSEVAEFSAWKDAGGRTRARATILYSAAQMRDAFSHNIDRYAFETLRPLISDVETFGIRAAIPKALWTRLKAAVLSGSAEGNTDADNNLLTIMRRAIAGWAMQAGLLRGWVQYQGHSVVHVEVPEQSGISTESTATPVAISAWLNRERSWSDRHMSDARQLIYDNKAAYAEAFEGADAWPDEQPALFPTTTTDEDETILPVRGVDLSTPGARTGIVRF